MAANDDPVVALAEALRRHYSDRPTVEPPGWGAPHRVLDAALAVDLDTDAVRIARERYRRAVAAPIEAFRERCPDVRTLADLHAQLVPSPEAFAVRELGADPWRGPVALALVSYLLDRLDAASDPGASEAARLAEALDPYEVLAADPADVASEAIGWHGLAYLQMRLGAEVVVPEPAVLALADEVTGGRGDAQTVAGAIREEGLPPLAVLQVLRSDWARGRAWSTDPLAPGAPEAWPTTLRRLGEALAAERALPWEAVVRLHRAAPNTPPGLDAAERGDVLATVRALGRQGRVPSFAAVADAVLLALYLAVAHPMDAETWFETAHAGALELAHSLQTTGEPLSQDVLDLLRTLFDHAGRRTTRHWYRTTWDA